MAGVRISDYEGLHQYYNLVCPRGHSGDSEYRLGEKVLAMVQETRGSDLLLCRGCTKYYKVNQFIGKMENVYSEPPKQDKQENIVMPSHSELLKDQIKSLKKQIKQIEKEEKEEAKQRKINNKRECLDWAIKAGQGSDVISVAKQIRSYLYSE